MPAFLSKSWGGGPGERQQRFISFNPKSNSFLSPQIAISHFRTLNQNLIFKVCSLAVEGNNLTASKARYIKRSFFHTTYM